MMEKLVEKWIMGIVAMLLVAGIAGLVSWAFVVNSTFGKWDAQITQNVDRFIRIRENTAAVREMVVSTKVELLAQMRMQAESDRKIEDLKFEMIQQSLNGIVKRLDEKKSR